MATTRDLNVSLPGELVELVQAKVAAGEYASESDVIGEGLRALEAREDETDDWIRGRIAPRYDRMTSDPGAALSIAEVRRMLSGEASGTA